MANFKSIIQLIILHVNRKQIQDDDDREIMRYKEMYLQDGDLYTDGRGRRRNFRWKDMGMLLT